MSAVIDVEVKGLIELQRKTAQMIADLHGAPIANAMQMSILEVTRDARMAAPVDTGNLRASIVPDLQMTPAEVQGIVGTAVTYGPYIEFGTKPHFPPVGALIGWVRRHNLAPAGQEARVAFLIARKISQRGTKAQPYLVPAFEKNETNIRRRFEGAVEVIVNK